MMGRARWLLPAAAAAALVAVGWPARSEPPPLPGPDDPEPLHTRMHAHYNTLRDIHRALLFGDLRKARRLALDLDDMSAPGHLPGWDAYAARIRDAASNLNRTRSAPRARRLVAELAVRCGDCHEESADVSRFVAGPEPFDDGSAAGRMARHEWAAESVWLGLIGPAPDLWRDGLTALAEPPLLPDAFTDDRARHRKVDTLSRRLVGMAARARALDGDEAQGRAFAEMLEVCAGCHALTR